MEVALDWRALSRVFPAPEPAPDRSSSSLHPPAPERWARALLEVTRPGGPHSAGHALDQGQRLAHQLELGGPSRHFLLDALLSRTWMRLLPDHTGFLVALVPDSSGGGLGSALLTDPQIPRLLLVYRRGRVESFFAPDLQSLKPGGAFEMGASDLVKALSDRYLVKIQGLFVAETDWQAWGRAKRPWAEVRRSIQGQRARLIPGGMALRSYLLARSLQG